MSKFSPKPPKQKAPVAQPLPQPLPGANAAATAARSSGQTLVNTRGRRRSSARPVTSLNSNNSLLGG